MLLQHLRELGTRIDGEYRRAGYDEACFAEIAETALASAELPEDQDLARVLDWITPPLASEQRAGDNFSDLSVVVHRSDAFFIQALFWVNASTTIHQHAFSGAFRVFSGASIHSRYHFEEQRRLTSRLRVGRCALESVELLAKGSVRRIYSGSGLTHALYHLERPTISIVARTYFEPWSAPQLALFPPRIAIDLGSLEQPWRSVERLLRVMRASEYEGLGNFLNERVARLPPDAVFFCFPTVRTIGAARGLMPAFLQHVDAAHPGLSDLLLEYDETFQARDQGVLLRRGVSDPALRTFVAALINAPNQEALLNLLAALRPDRQPFEYAAESLLALASSAPLPLKVTGDRLRDIVALLLRHNEYADIEAGLAVKYGPDQVQQLGGGLRETITTLRSVPAFRSAWATAVRVADHRQG
jgi:hypothetical protein